MIKPLIRFAALPFLWPLVMVASDLEHVILLHGLARGSGSMENMAGALEAAGYSVHNVGYESRSTGVHALAADVISGAVSSSAAESADAVHFVTHSMGGILVRDYLAEHRIPNLGRVVMLGPPNQGSEVVDKLRNGPLFKWINGPAGSELGTDGESVPARLGPATFPLGIIAGDRSINWINSMMIPGPDDGKVSVESSRLEGSLDHLVVHATHPLMMKNEEVIRQTLHFLKHGSFLREAE